MSTKTEYKVTIEDVTKEITAKEKVMLKQFADCTQIEDVDGLVFKPDYVAVLSVHNERSKNDKDYKKFIIVDTDGNKYITGSQSFYDALCDILSDMSECTDDEWAIKVIKQASKNYQGKYFLTCVLV